MVQVEERRRRSAARAERRVDDRRGPRGGRRQRGDRGGPRRPEAAVRGRVARARREGEGRGGASRVYTTGAPANYANAAKRFTEIYGISVTVNRKVDNDLLVQVNAEESTGKAVADIWVPTTKGIVLGALKNGWVVDAIGPNFFNKRFDRSKLMIGKGWINGSAILGMAWNTSCVSGGVSDIPDFATNPVFRGKLGMSDPRISNSQVDWYMWVEKTYGAGILEKLAAAEAEDLRIIAYHFTGGGLR